MKCCQRDYFLSCTLGCQVIGWIQICHTDIRNVHSPQDFSMKIMLVTKTPRHFSRRKLRQGGTQTHFSHTGLRSAKIKWLKSTCHWENREKESLCNIKLALSQNECKINKIVQTRKRRIHACEPFFSQKETNIYQCWQNGIKKGERMISPFNPE